MISNFGSYQEGMTLIREVMSNWNLPRVEESLLKAFRAAWEADEKAFAKHCEAEDLNNSKAVTNGLQGEYDAAEATEEEAWQKIKQ